MARTVALCLSAALAVSACTYLAVDASHAHMNIPATLMYVNDLSARPARVALVQPVGKAWKVATQLYPTADPEVFTAPDLAYFMDSPTELSAFGLRTWTVAGKVFAWERGYSKADLKRFGDKLSAKEAARNAGLPLLQGSVVFLGFGTNLPAVLGAARGARCGMARASAASKASSSNGLWRKSVAPPAIALWRVCGLRFAGSPMMLKAGIIVVLAATMLLGRQSAGELRLIEAGYYPSIELSRALDAGFKPDDIIFAGELPKMPAWTRSS